MKVPPGFPDILRNLLAQSVNGRKLDFITQPLKKRYFDFRLRGKFDGMEIQQVSLDRKRISAECRAISHVGHGIKTLLAHTRARDVDAIARSEFFVAAQVNGRNGVFRSVAASTAGGR